MTQTFTRNIYLKIRQTEGQRKPGKSSTGSHNVVKT